MCYALCNVNSVAAWFTHNTFFFVSKLAKQNSMGLLCRSTIKCAMHLASMQHWAYLVVIRTDRVETWWALGAHPLCGGGAACTCTHNVQQELIVNGEWWHWTSPLLNCVFEGVVQRANPWIFKWEYSQVIIIIPILHAGMLIVLPFLVQCCFSGHQQFLQEVHGGVF